MKTHCRVKQPGAGKLNFFRACSVTHLHQTPPGLEWIGLE
jgi:hypothetical protein